MSFTQIEIHDDAGVAVLRLTDDSEAEKLQVQFMYQVYHDTYQVYHDTYLVLSDTPSHK